MVLEIIAIGATVWYVRKRRAEKYVFPPTHLRIAREGPPTPFSLDAESVYADSIIHRRRARRELDVQGFEGAGPSHGMHEAPGAELGRAYPPPVYAGEGIVDRWAFDGGDKKGPLASEKELQVEGKRW